MRFLIITFFLTLVSTVYAKFPSPDLLEIYPPGGQAGTEVVVSVAGEGLEGMKELRFSNSQIKAERIYHPKTKHWTEPRAKGRTFKVTIPKGVKPGSYDVRVLGYYGLSSPRIFQVGETVEVNSEGKTANNSTKTALPLNLESPANGKIRKQLADYYKVSLKKGQRVLIHCHAIRLGSKLDARIAVYNSQGFELLNNNDYIDRDPMIDFTSPVDADYFVSVADQTWLGTTGYVYRLTVSQKPYIESIFPPVVKKGKKSLHVIYGRNLPGGKKMENGLEYKEVYIQAGQKSDELLLDGSRPRQGFYKGINYSFKGSNSFRLAFSDLQNIMESEQSGDIPIKFPCEINGRFNAEEDIDRYVFKAKKGDKLWLEIFADRQFTKSDPFVVIEKVTRDKDGREVTKEVLGLDDFRKVKTQGMYDIHTYDSGSELEITADGEYRIVVGDNFTKHGELHNYRIHLNYAKPDFSLFTFVEQFHFYGDRRTTVYPGALQLRPSGILPIRVRACRKGGKEYPINLRIEGLPPGVKALPANIFPGEEEGYIVLVADEKIKNWTGNIRVFGSINDGSKKVEREACGATLNWSGTEITYTYTQRLRARRTKNIPLSLLGDELPVPITLGQKEPDKVWEFKKKGSVKIPLVSTRSDKMKGAVTVMEFGAAHKLTFPFRIFVNGNKETTLNLSYKPNTTSNKHLPGEGVFIMRGWADINYKTYQKGAGKAKALKVKVDAKVKELTGAQTTAGSELKKVKAQLTAALAAEKKKAEDDKKKAAKAAKQPSKPKTPPPVVLKSVELKKSAAAAEAKLKTAKSDLLAIKVIQKEIHTQTAHIDKLTKEIKFRAGFFSLPVRFKVIEDSKVKK